MLSPNKSNQIDWELVCTIFPEVGFMEATQQDPDYHAEGNVKVHTEMAFKELLSLPEYKLSTTEDKITLEWATILHDIGKYVCTRIIDGKITSRGHSYIGRDIILRDIWKYGYEHFPIEYRHQIAGLVAMHGRPAFLLQGTPLNSDYKPEAVVIQCSQYCRNDLLTILAKADTLGRETKSKNLDILELYHATAVELNCLHKPYKFPNLLSRYKFLHSISGNYFYHAFEDYRTTCHILFGCPGSGKSTYIKNYFGDKVIISTDALRTELKLCAGDTSSELFELAYERFKQAIRDKKEVVWDATNTKRLFRQKPLTIAEEYNCKTILHIIDKDYKTCKQQDSKRTNPVGDGVLNLFASSLSFPDIKEAIELKHNT